MVELNLEQMYTSDVNNGVVIGEIKNYTLKKY